MLSKLDDHSMQNIVLAGDFNLALEPMLDGFNEKARNNNKARAVLKEFMDQFVMIDIWRQLHPTDKKYTYQKIQKTHPKYQASRLDFILINQSLTARAKVQIEKRTRHLVFQCVTTF